jgi:hypothetical protein
MPILVRTGVPSYDRPLPIPPRGWDGGEVVRLVCRATESAEGVATSLRLNAWPGFLGSAGPRSFGPLLADLLWDT